MRESGTSKQGLSVWKAIGAGLLWINLPVLVIICGAPIVPALVLVMYRPDDAAALDPDSVVWLVVSGLAAGFVIAWLWWSVMVPRWRLWAYERVDDIAKLKRVAVAVGLIWPDGWIFERTEIKSKAHAARERALERGQHSAERDA
jgi:hypothetical protein